MKKVLDQSLIKRIVDYFIKTNKLSIVGKLCIVLICFERFCKKYKLGHPKILEFINHVWKGIQMGRKDFDFNDWVKGFGEMDITGLGDPIPQEIVNCIPEEIFIDFYEFSECVVETSATNWYCAYVEKETDQMFFKAVKIAKKHLIPIPKFKNYMNGPVGNGWGEALSDEQLKKWRNSV